MASKKIYVDLDLNKQKLVGYLSNPMSTSVRTAVSLTVTDKGYKVYDTTENRDYSWNGTTWVPANFANTFISVNKTADTSVAGNAFTKVDFVNVISDVGSNFSTANSWYTVPSTGVYCITGSLRVDDTSAASFPKTNLGVGVHSSSADGGWFLWSAIVDSPPYNRTTIPYSRTDAFTAGDQLRMFCYFDTTGSRGHSGVTMQIYRLF